LIEKTFATEIIKEILFTMIYVKDVRI